MEGISLGNNDQSSSRFLNILWLLTHPSWNQYSIETQLFSRVGEFLSVHDIVLINRESIATFQRRPRFIMLFSSQWANHSLCLWSISPSISVSYKELGPAKTAVSPRCCSRFAKSLAASSEPRGLWGARRDGCFRRVKGRQFRPWTSCLFNLSWLAAESFRHLLFLQRWGREPLIWKRICSGGPLHSVPVLEC